LTEHFAKTRGQDCGGKASGLAFYDKKNSLTRVLRDYFGWPI